MINGKGLKGSVTKKHLNPGSITRGCVSHNHTRKNECTKETMESDTCGIMHSVLRLSPFILGKKLPTSASHLQMKGHDLQTETSCGLCC